MRECFQESFLRGFFSLTAVAKEAVRNVEHARAEAAHDFGKGGLVGIAREAGQFNFGRLFVNVRQKRSKECVRTASGSDRIDALLPKKTFNETTLLKSKLNLDPVATARGSDTSRLFVVTRSAHATASAATFFGLRFQLIELRLLLSRQNGHHLLMELKSRAHHLGLQGR
jgi:hypothetical protein